MKYKLINRTKIPSSILKTLIEFVAPKGIKNVTIYVRYNKDKYYWRAHAEALKRKKFISVWIQKEKIKFPKLSNTNIERKNGYDPVFLLNNIYEVLVTLFAHELRHIWQGSVSKQEFYRSKLCRFKDSDGEEFVSIRKMEKDACKYAKKILNKWRKL